MEFDAFLQFEVPGAVIYIFIGIHQIGNRFQGHTGFEQGVIGENIHIRASHRIVLRGRQRRSLAHGGNDNAVFLAALFVTTALFALVTGAAGQQARGHHCGQQEAEYSFLLHTFHLIFIVSPAKHR